MARIFNDSFEHGTLVRWTSASGVASASSPINGTYRLSTGGGPVSKSITALSEFYLGTYFRPDIYTSVGIDSVILWQSGSRYLGALALTVDRRLNFYTINHGVNVTLVATGTTVLTLGSVYHLQIRAKIDNAVGAFECKLNDIVEISYVNQDTQPGSETTVNNIFLGSIIVPGSGWAGTSSWSFDDVVINDTSGVADNTWPGIVKFARLTATGNGFYFGNWNKNSGVADDYTYVDEVPHDSDTTYLYTTVTNVYASFSMSDQALTNVTYKALITSAIARKDSGTAKLAVGIRDNDNNVNYIGTAADLGVTYGIVEERKVVDPSTGTDWTSSGINSTEALIISTA